jgi:hypothetical protein
MLSRLYLNENDLEGTLPTELGKLLSIQNLDLSDNAFSGSLPDTLNSLLQLEELRINRSRGGLNGTLPSFSGLENIEALELIQNMLSGTIPADFLSSRGSKEALRVDLGGNRLTGSVPQELSVFLDVDLNLEGNQIEGIPSVLCDNSHLDWMNGEVRLVGNCSAILCPPSTWSPHGKAVSKLGVYCESCPSSKYYGGTTCETSSSSLANRERQILDILFISTGGRYVCSSWR